VRGLRAPHDLGVSVEKDEEHVLDDTAAALLLCRSDPKESSLLPFPGRPDAVTGAGVNLAEACRSHDGGAWSVRPINRHGSPRGTYPPRTRPPIVPHPWLCRPVPMLESAGMAAQIPTPRSYEVRPCARERVRSGTCDQLQPSVREQHKTRRCCVAGNRPYGRSWTRTRDLFLTREG
jgi:hypothetical protein